ncbi:SdpA family antimicrobial peptide system protein [Streptomyces carpaticus]|uniref:SdpA family antimicrobial peptide system protein n=1 Tax=Streptomyces carpaticus TaxID=285558 RepID=UPI0031F901A2
MTTHHRWRSRPPAVLDVPTAWLRAVAGLWLVAIVYIAQIHLPSNVVTLPGQTAAAPAVRTLAPQGWSFFTKSPRDPELTAYALREGTWQELRRAPHAEPRNWFGLDRASRAQGVETALLLHQLPEPDWHPCDADLPACLAAAPPPAAVTNPSPEPTLCGRIAVVQLRPVPWAWRDLLPDTHTPDSLVSLDVTC